MESTEKEKKEGLIEFYDSFEDMLKFFCDNTTIHGTVRLNCSRENKMKTTFWLVLYFVAFAMMYWQFGQLTDQYWAYPTNTIIGLQSKGKIFPAVTICNLNPYRFDQVNMYINQLDQLAKETLYLLYEYEYEVPESPQQVVDLQDLLNNVTGQFNGNFILDQSIVLQKLQENGSGPALPGQKKFKVGFKLCNSSGDCYYKWFWSGFDAVHEWYKFHYINIMSNIPAVLNIANNFSRDYILTCHFNEMPCDEREYVHFHHPIYGNCFTINNHWKENSWYSSRPGKQYGLSIVVKTDLHDNMPLLSQAAGARIMIHNPNQPPLVEHQGFDIRPGTENSISVKQEEAIRLGGKYSQCTSDGSDLGIKILYNTSYTMQACLNSCFQYKMIEVCGCGYYFYPLPPGMEYCNYNKHPDWGYCFYQLYEKMLDHTLICFTQCPKQCKQTEYHLSAGTAKWPSPVSKAKKLLSLQERYNSTSKRSDISKINVYYEELSYRSVEETPSVSVTMLLSSMGGLWSWWFGSSVLSVAEIAELVLDTVAMVIIVIYQWKKQRAKRNDGTIGTDAASNICPVPYIDSKAFSSPQTGPPGKELESKTDDPKFNGEINDFS
ncbi:hypothetical protein XENTR_v10018941 [Xenopus tropicalis]|uniref:Amiloride-sensitive sodium channel subunit alpha n=1 Tax=Xenopus tropicalis TaxID=8364 RepID=F6VMZ3_XENTR|nr:amiloride-sensitive sodium channel subunit alpha [Xenopus tropicalis]KAE8593002.1 hypothetical protein XENTR_v10018941 [Xenopus tropicalis]KAE8593003.1 hypothetical protein XENTR_v10018941 [Xenopus tropicalis]